MNSRPHPYQGCALPLSYHSRLFPKRNPGRYPEVGRVRKSPTLTTTSVSGSAPYQESALLQSYCSAGVRRCFRLTWRAIRRNFLVAQDPKVKKSLEFSEMAGRRAADPVSERRNSRRSSPFTTQGLTTMTDVPTWSPTAPIPPDWRSGRPTPPALHRRA